MIRGINFKSDDEKDKVISLWYQAALNEYNFLPIDYFKNESKILYDNLDLQNILVCEYKDDILDFEINKGSMDDVFIEITGKEL